VGVVKAIVAARSHAQTRRSCHCCEGYSRRVALLYLVDASDRTLRICAGCVRALLYAARRNLKKRKAARP
jgi:hypothetical protein